MEKGGHTKQPKQGGPTTPGPAAAEAAKGRSIGCATELVWAVLKTALALAAFRQLLQSTLPTQERWDGWHAQWYALLRSYPQAPRPAAPSPLCGLFPPSQPPRCAQAPVWR